MQLAIGTPPLPLLEAHLVATRNELHATVVDRCVLEGEPESHAGFGFGVYERRILVTINLAADARRFEYHH